MANQTQIGASTGDVLATATNVHMAGVVYYVSSVIGDASNTGLNRQDPFASITTALSTAGTDDWIVLASDHSETLTANLAISSQATIIGEGRASGIPTPQITVDELGITLSGSDIHIRNVKFNTPTGAAAAPMIDFTGDRNVLSGCYLTGDENINTAIVRISSGAAQTLIKDTTIISTATRQSTASSNDPPAVGLLVAAAITDLWCDGLVIDGGEIGFSDYAFKASAGAITKLRGHNVSLLRGADATINSSSTGYFNVETRTGGVTVVW